MNNSLPQSYTKISLGIIIFGFLALLAIILIKEYNNEFLSKYWLLLPPILLAFGFAIFYKRMEKTAEFIFSIASALGALTLCVDTLANTQNDLFPYFFQSFIGYLILVVIASISLAKIISAILLKMSS
ncbi:MULTISPECIES: hypothetical protein [Enterobacteriaceae]|uniref:Uncharacterized protein n=1 Tax=Klebsiella quasipneumoniae subsp. quasipneumoniae TaxID=1667327 RepID=A0AAN1Y3E5_9ENTR|nr:MULTISPECIES: hypothetical protein [Enterobacteriaceae]EBU4479834.1 hypothetical protein [Salmonella enterica]HBC0022991.1 hypothetical protein [Enterobacter hormaechei subsp. steigerwaltii]HBM2629640.1 hypothetical protein [Enterobacter hormaechei subsp. hoffmannii]HEM8024520.1 hypothetical protein [Enterobacter ludwigii]EFO3462044.1 hypothetical protein [Escherichia coli]